MRISDWSSDVCSSDLLEVEWEEEMGTLWAFITPHDRPNYNIGLLRDTMAWQTEAKRLFDGPGSPLKYMVLGSRFPGVFNLGGDLEMFAECIERRERAKLLRSEEHTSELQSLMRLSYAV